MPGSPVRCAVGRKQLMGELEGEEMQLPLLGTQNARVMKSLLPYRPLISVLECSG